jgi:hypothetical protein
MLVTIHHSSYFSPHRGLSFSCDSSVVWIRFPVPFDMPGKMVRNPPLGWTVAFHGCIIVTALVIVDLAGPNDTAGPHESFAAMRPKHKLDTRARSIVDEKRRDVCTAAEI